MQKIKLLLLFNLLFSCFASAQGINNNQGLNTVCKKYPSPESLISIVPEKQQKFIKNLAKFAYQYKTSQNTVEQFLLRKKRQEFLAGQIKDRVFAEWIGRIEKLRTTKNGKAYLVIELADIILAEEKKSQISERDEGRVPLPGREDLLPGPHNRFHGGRSLRHRVRGRRHRARHQGGVHSHAKARRPRRGNQARGPEDPREKSRLSGKEGGARRAAGALGDARNP